MEENIKDQMTEDADEEMTEIELALPEEDWERLSAEAAAKGMDLNDYINARLTESFEREKAAMKKNIPLGIGEIAYMGIDELSESHMTLKFQIQCRNQDQPKVKRALNREIRMMFARNGITIPFPQVTLSSREEPEEEPDTDTDNTTA